MEFYRNVFRMNAQIGKEEMMAKLFGTVAERQNMGLDNSGYQNLQFNTLYKIVSHYDFHYDQSNTDSYNHTDEMVMYMDQISTTYKSCNAWTQGLFLSKSQNTRGKFSHKPRFCPLIPGSIREIKCLVIGYRIAPVVSNYLKTWFRFQYLNNFTNNGTNNRFLDKLKLCVRDIINWDNDIRLLYSINYETESDSDSENDSENDSDSDSFNNNNQDSQPETTTSLEIAIKISESPECTICYSDLNTENIGWWKPCGHVCCIECQKGMLNSGRTLKCHICRADVANCDIGNLMTIIDN